MINRTDMLEIGAVADLRSYLNSQETVCFVCQCIVNQSFIPCLGLTRCSYRRASEPSLSQVLLVRHAMVGLRPQSADV